MSTMQRHSCAATAPPCGPPPPPPPTPTARRVEPQHDRGAAHVDRDAARVVPALLLGVGGDRVEAPRERDPVAEHDVDVVGGRVLVHAVRRVPDAHAPPEHERVGAVRRAKQQLTHVRPRAVQPEVQPARATPPAPSRRRSASSRLRSATKAGLRDRSERSSPKRFSASGMLGWTRRTRGRPAGRSRCARSPRGIPRATAAACRWPSPARRPAGCRPWWRGRCGSRTRWRPAAWPGCHGGLRAFGVDVVVGRSCRRDRGGSCRGRPRPRCRPAGSRAAGQPTAGPSTGRRARAGSPLTAAYSFCWYARACWTHCGSPDRLGSLGASTEITALGILVRIAGERRVHLGVAAGERADDDVGLDPVRGEPVERGRRGYGAGRAEAVAARSARPARAGVTRRVE